MAVVERVFDKHVLSSKKNAKDDSERKLVLDSALNEWGTRWVGKIQRIEPPGKDFYYALWHHPDGVAERE